MYFKNKIQIYLSKLSSCRRICRTSSSTFFTSRTCLVIIVNLDFIASSNWSYFKQIIKRKALWKILVWKSYIPLLETLSYKKSLTWRLSMVCVKLSISSSCCCFKSAKTSYLLSIAWSIRCRVSTLRFSTY